MSNKVVVLDNGAYEIKAAIPDAATKQNTLTRSIPNCITRGKGDRRTFVADQLNTCRDYSGLYYRLPFEKGFLTNWEIEKEIWDRIFSKDVLQCEPEECGLVVTEPCFNLPNIQQTYDQIVFEEYEFESYYRTTAPQLCLHNDIPSLFGDPKTHPPDCVVIVDSGYSFTHIVPFLKGKPVAKAIRRISVGGKLLTNHLKEVVSFRHYNMMDETYLMNEVKEACCYVSQDVFKDLDLCKKSPKDNPIIQEYVLPDFSSNKRGYIKARPTGKSALSANLLSATSDQQVLLMNNERFTIPEILFHPSDIGMHQAGIPETIVQSVSACDEGLHGLMYANVVLVGGNAELQGFRERVETDLRNLAPADFEVRVTKPNNPITYAWQGGAHMAMAQKGAEYKKKAVTRQEYHEIGSEACRRKFGGM